MVAEDIVGVPGGLEGRETGELAGAEDLLKGLVTVSEVDVGDEVIVARVGCDVITDGVSDGGGGSTGGTVTLKPAEQRVARDMLA